MRAVAFRMRRAAGLAGALMLGLLSALALTGRIERASERLVPLPPQRPDAIIWPSRPNGQFRSYLITLGLALGCVALFALLRQLVRRRRRAALALDVGAPLAALAWAFGVSPSSPFLGLAAVAAAVLATAWLAPHASRGHLPDRDTSPRVLDVWAVAVQTACLVWGAWITGHGRGAAVIVVAGLLVVALSAWRAVRLLRAAEPFAAAALRREAVAGLPFLLLPVVGILRVPSPLFLAATGALYAILLPLAARDLAAPARARLARLPPALPALLAAWAVLAVYSIPHRFRELPRLNHRSHEAGKYAWLNSFYHGKLFMADTALLYGPLRELVLAIYVRLTGTTAEQVRAGQILIHLAFLGATVAMAWIAVRRRLWALLWCGLLVITATLALPWLDALRMTAFGWSDIGRTGLPMLALVGALALASRPGHLVGWGAVAGAGILYSQETGPTAIVATVAALVADAWLRAGPLGWRARAARALAQSAAFLGGAALVCAVFVGAYALLGRAGLLMRTMFEFVSLFASGSSGGLPFPVDERSFASWAALTRTAPHEGMVLEYTLPVAVYALAGCALTATAIARRWTARATLLTGLLAYGVASFRVAMGRSDYYHLIAVTAPAVLLLVALTVDACDALARLRVPSRPWLRASVLLVAPVMLFGLKLTGATIGFWPRTRALLVGEETPSTGPPFRYPEIPRAGDIFLPADTVDLVHAIQRRSGPNDKVFIHNAFIEGAELYFLADRVNPTRCDLLAEIISTKIRREVFDSLRADPPVLDVGRDLGMFDADTIHYLQTGWRTAEVAGGAPVRVRVR
jgi:hypothetical protein